MCSTSYTFKGGQNLTFELEKAQSRCYREISRPGQDFAGAGNHPAVADCEGAAASRSAKDR